MPRVLFIFCLVALTACVPASRRDYFAVNDIPPAQQISFDGRVGELSYIGESENQLVARGAVMVQAFESPPSSLYQFTDREALIFVCRSSGRVFQLRLPYTDAASYGYVTPFGLGFSSSLADLQAAGLRNVTSEGVQYFSYGYDEANTLMRDVGFYFSFDEGLGQLTVIDVIAPCS